MKIITIKTYSWLLMLTISTLCPASLLNAQVSLNTDGAAPDPSAIMDLTANNMGFLLPRMDQSERLAISSPAGGLLLYDNGPDNEGMYYNAGAPNMPNWTRLNTIIQGTVDICDRRIPVDSVQNNDGTIRINQPGSYYFTKDITIDQSNGSNLDGVTIDADNVTLDLNGFTLQGDFTTTDRTDDGIFIVGDQDNITIKNGVVSNWGGDGINALNCDNCNFIDLIVEGNDGDGLVADFAAIIYQCIARGNGIDGLEGDDNTIIYDCEASNNGDNGIQASEGSRVINCTSTGNETDGIDAGGGSRVEGCVVAENEVYGIDIALGGQVINCTANRNGRHGIDIANSCIARFNKANENGTCVAAGTCTQSLLESGSVGAGIRTFANSQVTDNVCRNNFYGIRISSTDTYVSDNIVTGNSHAGLTLSSSGSFAIRNRAQNNGFNPIPSATTAPGNYSIVNNASFGPIIDLSSTTGNLLSIPGINNPYANFIY